MPLNLCKHQDRAQEAVKAFWEKVSASGQEQIGAGEADGSGGARVANPHNMDRFMDLMRCIIKTKWALGRKFGTPIRVGTPPLREAPIPSPPG